MPELEHGECLRARQRSAHACCLLLLLLVSLPLACSQDTSLPRPAPAEPAEADSPAGTSVTVTRSFTWSYWPYSDREWTWKLQVPRSLYLEYKNHPRPPTRNYSVYVTDPRDEAYTLALTQRLARDAQELDLDAYERLHFIAAFVQHLAYTYDVDTTGFDDYPRYPLETLVEEGGDCEDTSILLAEILYNLGYDAVVLRLPAHVAVGVAADEKFCGTYYEQHGTRYFYLETTGKAGRIGLVPENYATDLAYLYHIDPVPVIDHSWEVTVDDGSYHLEVLVENLGTAASETLNVLAGFDASQGSLWNASRSRTFRLEPGASDSVHVELQSPRGQRTRLMVYVVEGERSIDSSRSQWFDT